MKVLILALLFTSIFCLKHKLRGTSQPPDFKDFTMEDECKIQRCIMSDMAYNWPGMYGEKDGKQRQIQCFKTCHEVTCEKKAINDKYSCKLAENGKPYPENYPYEPLTESFDDYKDNERAMEYLKKRNA